MSTGKAYTPFDKAPTMQDIHNGEREKLESTLAEITRRLTRLEAHLGLPEAPQEINTGARQEIGSGAPEQIANATTSCTDSGAVGQTAPLPPDTTVASRPLVEATGAAAADTTQSPVVGTAGEPTSHTPFDETARTKPSRRPPQNGNLESRIGTVWLNRLGILILVVGLAYGVVQAYQYIGPALKLAAGFAAGAALIVFGEITGRKEKYRFWGLGLAAGGYALTYFTAYAMHNIESVRVLASPLIDSLLLIGIAAVAMAHALFRKEENIALISALLAFATLSLSAVSGFTLVATAVIVAALALLTITNKWFKVFALSTAGSYATFLLITRGQIASAGFGVEQAFFLAGGFLTLFWVIAQATALLINNNSGAPDSAAKNRITQGVLALNAFAYVLPMLLAMAPAFLEWRWLFLAGTGALYIAQSFFARERAGATVSNFNLIAGLTLASASVPLKFDGGAVAIIWFAEIAVLTLTALRARSAPLYLFSLPLGAVSMLYLFGNILVDSTTFAFFGLEAERRILVSLAAALSFAVAARASRQGASAANAPLLLENWLKEMKVPLSLERIGFFAFSGAACLVLWVMPLYAVNEAYIPLCWALEASLIVALSFRLKETVGHYAAVAVFATAGAGTVIAHELLNLSQIAPVVLLTAAASLSYTLVGAGTKAASRNLHQLYLLAASFLLYAHTYFQFGDNAPLSGLLLFLEGSLITMLGLRRRDATNARLGVVGNILGLIMLAGSIALFSWATVLPVVSLAFLSYAAFHWAPDAQTPEPEGILDGFLKLPQKDERAIARTGFALAGSALLAVAFHTLIDEKWLALFWSLEGVALVIAGFALIDKTLRVSGLALFGLAVGRLLLIDLSGAGTTQRVISFVLAGLALLAASYVYTWLGNRIKPDQPEDEKEAGAAEPKKTA